MDITIPWVYSAPPWKRLPCQVLHRAKKKSASGVAASHRSSYYVRNGANGAQSALTRSEIWTFSFIFYWFFFYPYTTREPVRRLTLPNKCWRIYNIKQKLIYVTTVPNPKFRRKHLGKLGMKIMINNRRSSAYQCCPGKFLGLPKRLEMHLK